MPRSLLSTALPPGGKRAASARMTMPAQMSVQSYRQNQIPLPPPPSFPLERQQQRQQHQRRRTMPAPLVLHNGDKVLSGADLLSSGGASSPGRRFASTGHPRSPRRASAAVARARAKSEVSLSGGDAPAVTTRRSHVLANTLYAPGQKRTATERDQGQERSQETLARSIGPQQYTRDRQLPDFVHTQPPSAGRPEHKKMSTTWSWSNFSVHHHPHPPESPQYNSTGASLMGTRGDVLVGVAL